jgi:glycosyltransferase involved in cell wall biosynthesis
MMRVLHVYSGNLFGGIETALVTFARHQRVGPELQQEVALCFDGRLRRQLETAGMAVRMLPSPRASRPHTVRAARRALAALLASESFDRVVCHAVWSQALFGGVVRRAGIPLVFVAHDAVTGRHWSERWARRVRPQLVIANSVYTARTIVPFYPDVPVTVVRYAVDTTVAPLSPPERMNARRAFDTADDAVVVVQASRMEAWKGHTTLVEALARLPAALPWTCWIAGGAQRPRELEYERSLRALVRDRGVDDRIRFVGDRPDVPRLLAAADIYCQPNARPEPFGIVFIEALAAGRPVVSSAAGGATEVVDDRCGRLVAVGDVDALALALRTLIADQPLRASLGAAAPARARELCDPTRQVRAWVDVLSRVADPVRVPS